MASSGEKLRFVWIRCQWWLVVDVIQLILVVALILRARGVTGDNVTNTKMREDNRLLQHKRVEEFAVAEGSSWKIQKVSIQTYGALKRIKHVERWKIKRNNELRKGKGAVANGETSHTRVRQIQCRTHVVLGGFLGWCVWGGEGAEGKDHRENSPGAVIDASLAQKQKKVAKDGGEEEFEVSPFYFYMPL
jgi:hypothetical protein